MAIKKVFKVTVLMEDHLGHLTFDDLIEEGQDGAALYGTELLSIEVITDEDANSQSIDLGSDGTFFNVD